MDLLRTKFATAEGMLLVYEFDGDDGFWGVERHGFSDTAENY
jgi:hypothetical protein